MDLKILTVNIPGLRFKKAFRTLVHSLKPHILCISETHLAPQATYGIKGYYAFYHNRTGRLICNNRGGAALYVRSDLIATGYPIPAHLLDGVEAVAVTLTH